MAFCFQRNFGVPTENVGPDLLRSLMRGREVAEKVALVRQIKESGFALSWLETEGYQDWRKWLKPEKRAALDKLSDQKKVEAYCDGIKRGLPLVIFIANYLELKNKKEVIGRWRQKAGVCLNGLAVLDLDHVVKSHDGKAAREYWTQIIAHLDLKEIGILMAFVSPSGDGLKVVFKARLEWGNLIDNQQEMAKLLGVSEFIDKKCKDGSRGHFLTTEQDLLYIDEEIFEYENQAFGEKYNEQYREGRTSPGTSPDPSEGGEGLPVSIKHAEQSLPGRPSSPSGRSGGVSPNSFRAETNTSGFLRPYLSLHAPSTVASTGSPSAIRSITHSCVFSASSTFFGELSHTYLNRWARSRIFSCLSPCPGTTPPSSFSMIAVMGTP